MLRRVLDSQLYHLCLIGTPDCPPYTCLGPVWKDESSELASYVNQLVGKAVGFVQHQFW